MKESIYVSNMSCKHCVARITKALEEKSIDAEVVLETKTVLVDKETVDQARAAIKEAGYSPE